MACFLKDFIPIQQLSANFPPFSLAIPTPHQDGDHGHN
jgi:hypothetical protein